MSGSKTKSNDLQSVAETDPVLQRHVLGNGLELWHVLVGYPKEQSLNARVMAPDAFNQLTDNIKREQRLESMPLCAFRNGTLELISGHHRLRAAKKAGLESIWVMVDVTDMSADKLRSKQLSHNSLQGMDDAELVARIFEQIEDSSARIEAFINLDLTTNKVSFSQESKELEVEFQGKSATILFLPLQMKVFKESLELLKNAQVDEVFLATMDDYDTMKAAMDVVSEKFNITSIPTLLSKMAEIVIEHCNDSVQPEN